MNRSPQTSSPAHHVVACPYVHAVVVTAFITREREREGEGGREGERERERERGREGGRENKLLYIHIAFRILFQNWVIACYM